MKKILIISPDYPYPQKCGFTVRVGDMCKHLANHFELHFFICRKTEHIENLQKREIFGKIFFSDECLNPSGNLFGLKGRIARRLFPPHFDNEMYVSSSPLKQLSSIQDREKYDVCMVHTPLLGRCLEVFPETVLKIIDSHDIWHQKYLNFKALGYGRLLSQFRDKQREINLYRKTDLVLAISLWDHDYMLRYGVNSIYCPVSFTPDPLPTKKPSGHDLLYASGSGPVNIDAIHYFIREIMPIVQKQIPDLKLKISNVSDEIKERYSGRSDIELLPFFKDAHDAYRAADIVIVPLRYASGLKIKVLESFSLGKPTIVSPAAVQGVPVSKFAQERISIEPDIFASEVIRALKELSYREKLSGGGLDIIRNEYTAEKIYKGLIESIEKI